MKDTNLIQYQITITKGGEVIFRTDWKSFKSKESAIEAARMLEVNLNKSYYVKMLVKAVYITEVDYSL